MSIPPAVCSKQEYPDYGRAHTNKCQVYVSALQAHGFPEPYVRCTSMVHLAFKCCGSCAPHHLSIGWAFDIRESIMVHGARLTLQVVLKCCP